MTEFITYEQPLNERVRTFLRIEHLFNIYGHFAKGAGEWDSRLSLAALLDVVDLLGRSDVKTELIKELERHAGTLSALERNPGVDQSRLQMILQDLNEYLVELKDTGFQPGQTLRRDELVQSVKQRNAIPGGTCNFDLPGYHFWLNRSARERQADVESWQQDLSVIRKGLRLALHMIRNSTTPTRERAPGGFFQKPMESGTACQLVRVVLPAESKVYPEISAGRHRFTIRFMEQGNTSERPVQCREDVDFELHCCIL